MTTGAGIAIAGIWFAAALIGKDKRVTGVGLALALICAMTATFVVVGGGK